MIRLGVVCMILGGGIFAFGQHESGGTLLIFGLVLVVAGAHTLRRSRESDQAAAALADLHEESVARLDRGETFDQVALDYERLHKIPRVHTLYHLGALIRVNVGMGRNPEVNEAAVIVLNRQAASVSSESPEEFLETLSPSRNVFFVDKSAYFVPDRENSRDRKPGVFVVSRRFLYFFVSPEERSLGGVFAEGLFKEKIYDMTRVPYLGVASFAIEAVTEAREGMHDDFDPEALERLKKLFGLAGSFAVPLATIAGLERVRRTTLFGWLPRERLVIVTKDTADREGRYGFESSRLFDEQWFMTASGVIRTACVMEGRLLLS